MDKFVSKSFDVTRTFHVEDGIKRTGFHQPHDGIKKHVRVMNDRSDLQTGNKWAGSIPTVLLIDWLDKRSITMDVFARNEGGVADQFYKWLCVEHPKLMSDMGRKHMKDTNRGNIR